MSPLTARCWLHVFELLRIVISHLDSRSLDGGYSARRDLGRTPQDALERDLQAVIDADH